MVIEVNMEDFHPLDLQMLESSSAIPNEVGISIDHIGPDNEILSVNESSPKFGGLDEYNFLMDLDMSPDILAQQHSSQMMSSIFPFENQYQQYTPQDFLFQIPPVVEYRQRSVETGDFESGVIILGSADRNNGLSEVFPSNLQESFIWEPWIAQAQEDNTTLMSIFQNHIPDTSTGQLLNSHLNQPQEIAGTPSIILPDQQCISSLAISDNSGQNQIRITSPHLNGNNLLEQQFHSNNYGSLSQLFPFMQYQQQQSQIPLINFGMDHKEYFPAPSPSLSIQPTLAVQPASLFTETSITAGSLENSYHLYNLRDSRTCFASSSVYNMGTPEFSTTASQLGSDSATPSTTGAITPVMTLSSGALQSGSMSEADTVHLHQQLQAVQAIQAVQTVGEYSTNTSLLPNLAEVKSFQQSVLRRSSLIQSDVGPITMPYRKRFRSHPQPIVHCNRKEFSQREKRLSINANSGSVPRSYFNSDIGNNPAVACDDMLQSATTRTQAYGSPAPRFDQTYHYDRSGHPLMHYDNQATTTGSISNPAQALSNSARNESLHAEQLTSCTSNQNQEPISSNVALVVKKRTRTSSDSSAEYPSHAQKVTENIAAQQAVIIQDQQKQVEELRMRLEVLQNLQKQQQSGLTSSPMMVDVVISEEIPSTQGQASTQVSTTEVTISRIPSSLVQRRGRPPRCSPYSKTGGTTITSSSRRSSPKVPVSYGPQADLNDSGSLLPPKDEVSGLDYDPNNDDSIVIPTADKKDLEPSSPTTTKDEHSFESFPLPIKCKQASCPRTFASLGLLKSHLVSHQEDKPYWCDICSFDGITPRPITDESDIIRAKNAKSSRSKSQESSESTEIPEVLHYEVKRYKRNHDLLRHKREQHPPMEVKIQREAERVAARAARKKRNEIQKKEKSSARSKSKKPKAEPRAKSIKSHIKEHADVAAIVQNYLSQQNSCNHSDGSSSTLPLPRDEVSMDSGSDHDTKILMCPKTRYRQKMRSSTSSNLISEQNFEGQSQVLSKRISSNVDSSELTSQINENQALDGLTGPDSPTCLDSIMSVSTTTALVNSDSECDTSDGEETSNISSMELSPKSSDEKSFSEDLGDESDIEVEGYQLREVQRQSIRSEDFNSPPSTTVQSTFRYLSSIDGAIDSFNSDDSEGEVGDDDSANDGDDDDDEYHPSTFRRGRNTNV
ncbi:hypothetical protein BGZ76_001715 [Entomortierella beljakovae]|nr:hypothetical protein BGZ76_001715 [Entomortierella beljakovae]